MCRPAAAGLPTPPRPALPCRADNAESYVAHAADRLANLNLLAKINAKVGGWVGGLRVSSEASAVVWGRASDGCCLGRLAPGCPVRQKARSLGRALADAGSACPPPSPQVPHTERCFHSALELGAAFRSRDVRQGGRGRCTRRVWAARRRSVGTPSHAPPPPPPVHPRRLPTLHCVPLLWVVGAGVCGDSLHRTPQHRQQHAHHGGLNKGEGAACAACAACRRLQHPCCAAALRYYAPASRRPSPDAQPACAVMSHTIACIVLGRYCRSR